MFINDQQALGSLSRHTNTHFCTSSHTPTQCPLIPPTHSIYAQTYLKHLHTVVNNHRSVGQLKRQRFPVLAKCLSELSRGVEGWAEEPLVDICDSRPWLRWRRDRAYQQQMSQQRVCAEKSACHVIRVQKSMTWRRCRGNALTFFLSVGLLFCLVEM